MPVGVLKAGSSFSPSSTAFLRNTWERKKDLIRRCFCWRCFVFFCLYIYIYKSRAFLTHSVYSRFHIANKFKRTQSIYANRSAHKKVLVNRINQIEKLSKLLRSRLMNSLFLFPPVFPKQGQKVILLRDRGRLICLSIISTRVIGRLQAAQGMRSVALLDSVLPQEGASQREVNTC